MSRNKLARFAELKILPNVREKETNLRGKWAKKFFSNSYPVVLELACGRGEYTVGLAGMFPEKNFIGIDRKGERIWYGAKNALEAKLSNAGFLRGDIDFLPEYFAKGEVDEIWITFPDPYPKKTQIKRRLTHPRFLEIYRRVLKPGGLMHLKTDSESLINFTLEQVATCGGSVLKHMERVPEHASDPFLNLRTAYEKRFRAQGKAIGYTLFTL